MREIDVHAWDAIDERRKAIRAAEEYHRRCDKFRSNASAELITIAAIVLCGIVAEIIILF